MKHLLKIKAEYSFNEMPVNDKTVFEWMLKADSVCRVEKSDGDLEAGQKLVDKIFESEFHDPYLAHARYRNTYCSWHSLKEIK